MEAVMYRVQKVESSRTHEETIDVELFDNEGGKVRAFVDVELAMQLVGKIFTALATPHKEEEPNLNGT